MTDLKPCPFCGYKVVEILADDNEHLYYRYFSQCQRCGAGAKRGHTKEEAIKEWNRSGWQWENALSGERQLAEKAEHADWGIHNGA